jgi:hypothetical protein
MSDHVPVTPIVQIHPKQVDLRKAEVAKDLKADVGNRLIDATSWQVITEQKTVQVKPINVVSTGDEPREINIVRMQVWKERKLDVANVLIDLIRGVPGDAIVYDSIHGRTPSKALKHQVESVEAHRGFVPEKMQRSMVQARSIPYQKRPLPGKPPAKQVPALPVVQIVAQMTPGADDHRSGRPIQPGDAALLSDNRQGLPPRRCQFAYAQSTSYVAGKSRF